MIPLLRYMAGHARVTLAILLTCVVVFAAEAIGATDYDVLFGTGRGLPPVLEFGVVFQPLVLSGEWWRLITAGFLHFGILHLFLNMYALFYVGLILEPRFGSPRFAAIYGVALVGGNLAACFFQSPESVSAGASGAIMGCFAAMAVSGFRLKLPRQWLQSALVPIGMTLLYGLSRPGISNAAHVGGLVAGGIATWLVGISPEWQKIGEAQRLQRQQVQQKQE
jgi:membrane associated rhomboid family serine protease